MEQKTTEIMQNVEHRRHAYPKPLVDVTQKEIDEGAIADSRKCMIAEAVKHCVPNAKAVSVDLATIRFTDGKSGNRYTYMTPYGAQQALVQFDQGLKPEPFSFKLRTLFQVRPKPLGHKTPTGLIIDDESTDRNGKRAIHAPVKVGGRASPRTVLGIIRRFGLRTLPPGTPAAKLAYAPKEPA